MKSFILFIVFISQTVLSSAITLDVYEQASLLESNLDNGKQSYKLCATCHLDNGMGKANGSFPVIASQHKLVVIKQLKDIQNKHRQNPTMRPFSDPKTIGGVQAIADVSGYIQALLNTGDNGVGSGEGLDHGKFLYLNNCTGCHGVEGQGNNKKVLPKIKAQHYAYLLRQLKWIRDGYRSNSDPDMLALIKNMSDKDLEDLADYVSRL